MVIATDKLGHSDVAAMLALYNPTLRSHTVHAVVTSESADALKDFSAILGKTPGTQGPRAFVCHDGICHLPTQDLAAFTAQLQR